jgi:D-3-phosphoglycerate dehydrogenase
MKIVNIDVRNDYTYERARLAAAGVELLLRKTRSEAEIVEACADAHIVLVESSPLPARVIDALGACRLIMVYGVGYDRVDVAAATRHGIVVAHAPAYCTDEVADHAAGLLLASARRIATMDRNVRAGGWYDFPQNGPLRRLGRLTLGLVGFGRIGRAVARRMAGFGLRILATDPYIPAASVGPGIELVPLGRLLAESDLVSLHVPLTDETRAMIGEAELAAMKPTAMLVNTSRGAVVDEEALVGALAAKRIAGAALDVVVQEPLPAASALRQFEHVILTPHFAGSSEDSVAELKVAVADAVEAVVKGHWPPFPVNPGVRPRVPLRPWAELQARA